MFFKRLQSFLFISFFVLKRCFQVIVKLSVWNIVVKKNAGCNEFESNKVDCRMCLVRRKIRQGSWKKQNEERNGRGRYRNSYTKIQKLLLESLRNSTIYNVSICMYYQYFTFKGLDYTRNIGFSFIFLQIFFQRHIFRKLRITVITSSQRNVWVLFALSEQMCAVDL